MKNTTKIYNNLGNTALSETKNHYRFGFNGKEKDDELYNSTGTSYDYGFRIYNPRIAKFLSVDPLTKSYPWYTPYQFAGNKPVWAIDMDGLEEYIFQYAIDDKLNVTLIQKTRNVEMREKINANGIHSGIFEAYNKATGEKLTNYERGKVQYQYFYKGKQVNIHRKINGNFAKGAGNFLTINNGDNWFGSIYIGPNNPKSGSEADYRREPQDMMDAAALQHDKDYDEQGAEGAIDALFDTNTMQADIDLVQRSNTVIDMYNNKDIDPYTNKVVSKATYKRALKVKIAFSQLAISKATDAGLRQPGIEKVQAKLKKKK